ncbi:hypothetical protein [Photobacterium nomapromontoriensis]|uniref:hypothetical protein n=1 Tax=Photobacterium nomapromontoriensis TaxID=2910237 RepID=UPI003D106AB4
MFSGTVLRTFELANSLLTRLCPQNELQSIIKNFNEALFGLIKVMSPLSKRSQIIPPTEYPISTSLYSVVLPENGQNILKVKEKPLHLSDELVKLVEYQIYFFLSE